MMKNTQPNIHLYNVLRAKERLIDAQKELADALKLLCKQNYAATRAIKHMNKTGDL